jgi:DNA helicase-2/ATP-dependent DNA helicase PcrA
VQETDADLLGFISHASLEAGDHQADVHADAVQLMTVHAAKGLEFNTVFITGLEEGLFPHDNSAHDANAVEEERRLMYVAITRARERLTLSWSQTRMLHGQTRYHIASRFLQDIPSDLLHYVNQRPVKMPTMVDNTQSALRERGAAASHGHPWRIGQAVCHAKFGAGVITNLEGHAEDARLQVNFAEHGSKWLAAQVARLTPI